MDSHPLHAKGMSLPVGEAYPQPLPEGKGDLKYLYATRWGVDRVLNMAVAE